MSAFLVFTLIFTFCLLIYYAAMIALDLRRQGKQPSTHHEEFDVSGMQGEEAPKVIAEAFAEAVENISVEVGTEPEQQPVQDPVLVVQPAPPAPKEPTPAELKVGQVQEHLDPIQIQGSAELSLDEFYRQITDESNQRGAKFGIHPKN